MRTTIEISDAVLAAARRAASDQKTTLRTIIEVALRRYLETIGAGPR